MNTFVRTTTALAALTLGLAGCTSSPAAPTGTASAATNSPSGGGATSGSPSGSPTGSPSGSPTGSPTDTTTASPSGSPSPTPSPSQTLPPFTNDAGKTFTTLTHAAGALVSANGVVAQVLVHPDSITQGSVADLGGGKVPKGKLPLFVTVTYTNVGKTTLELPSLGTPLTATESNANQAVPYTDKPVAKCLAKASPDSFALGSVFTDCYVFLVDKGIKLGKLSYRPTNRASEITWKLV